MSRDYIISIALTAMSLAISFTALLLLFIHVCMPRLEAKAQQRTSFALECVRKGHDVRLVEVSTRILCVDDQGQVLASY